MAKNLSKGDVIVETTDEVMYKIEEDAPPYPVKARPYGKHSNKVIEIPEKAMSGYMVGSPQSMAEELLQLSGFSHEDPRCTEGIIVTKEEVIAAFGGVSAEVGYTILSDWLTDGVGAKTAADVLLTLFEKYEGREQNAVNWFDNVEFNELGKPVCECGHHILDKTY